MQGIAGGDRGKKSAKAITADVHKFFTNAECSSSSSTSANSNALLSRHNLEQYYRQLKGEGKAPSTIQNKLRTIRHAVTFIQHHTDNSKKGERRYMEAQRVINVLTLWIRSLNRSKKLQRQKHSTEVTKKLPFIKNPTHLLESKALHKEIKSSVKRLRKAYNDKDAKLLTAYCAAHAVFQNSQRSGVVQNATKTEYKSRIINSRGKTIINILGHKTGPQGRVQLVLTNQAARLLDLYYGLVRRHIIPQNDECRPLLFLRTNGKEYDQVYRRMSQAFRGTRIRNIQPPKPSEFRIITSTKAARHCSDKDNRGVAKHLNHSVETQRQYYEFANTKDAVHAHKIIKKLTKHKKQ